MPGERKFPLPKVFVRWWPSVVSGLLLLLAFPPFNLGLLVLVGLVPWLISLRDVTGKQAWRSGYGLGFLYGMGQLFWIAQLCSHWLGSFFIGLFPWLGATALYAIYFGWTGVLIRHAWARNTPWAIPILWAGIEVFRAFIPMFAFPWGLVANPLWPYTSLIQTAHFGSIFLVSAWVVLANVVVALVLTGSEYRQFRILLATFCALAAMSLVSMKSEPATTPFPVTIGQPGVDVAFGDQSLMEEALGKSIDRIAADASADGSKLLVLPEGVAVAPTMPPHVSFTIPKDLPVIFGARRGENPAFQSAFAFDGKRWQYEDKTRLVIFGEYVPLRETFPFIAQAFKLPNADMVPGRNGVKAFDIAGMRVGPVICFEAVFPDVAFKQALNGSRMLSVISVDDWFMDGNAPDQLRAATIWRSIETGLPAVRAATTGYSLACDGHGRIIAALPLREARGLKVNVPIPNESPVFRGAFVFPLVACLMAFVFPWAKRRKVAEVKS